MQFQPIPMSQSQNKGRKPHFWTQNAQKIGQEEFSWTCEELKKSRYCNDLICLNMQNEQNR